MRPFIQRTAGATFTCGSSLSLIFRKDYIEYVFKLQGGFYGIIHLIPAADGQMLFADWGDYFQFIIGHNEPEKLMRMLEKPCPKVIDLMTGASGNSLVTIRGGQLGISRQVDAAPNPNLIALAGDEKILDEAEQLLGYCLDLFHEIRTKCSFPEWKKRLVNLYG